MALQCIVAGGAGFLGRHLCRALLERGDAVLCVDNFSTSDASELAPLFEHPHFTLVTARLEELADREADLVFHLASPASPGHYQRLALETLSVNSLGTLRLAELAERAKARLIFTSTSEVYGDPLVHPQSEDYWGNVNPLGVRACYDEGKRFAEALLMEYHRKRQLDVRIARLFNTYGPGMALRDGRAVPEFIMAALEGRQMPLHNGGGQTRSLCFVADTVAGLLRLADEPGLDGEVFNLGNPDEHSVEDIAKAVADAVGVPARMEAAPRLPDDPARRCPDISKARRMLAWEPRVGLDEGLRATVADFRARLAAEPR